MSARASGGGRGVQRHVGAAGPRDVGAAGPGDAATAGPHDVGEAGPGEAGPGDTATAGAGAHAADDAALVDALVRSAFAVTAALTSIGAEHDLSLTQVRVLGILRDRTLRMADLADHLGLERSTLSGLVDRAERRGLLARRRAADDGRAIEVAMTSEGRALADAAYVAVAAALIPTAAHLGPADRRALAQLLDSLLGPAPAS